MSIDGFYAAADGNPLVLNMDEAFDAYNRERIEAADAILLGRSSYEGFSAYWPYVADAPEDPANRALSADNRATSRAYNTVPKVVVSDSLQVPRENPWYGTTTVISRWDAGPWIRAAREDDAGQRSTPPLDSAAGQRNTPALDSAAGEWSAPALDSAAGEWSAPALDGGAGDILIFGSRITWNRLLAEGLIDELHLMVSPTALSQGMPIFTTTADLTLLETRRFDNSDNVLLRYAAK